MSECVVVLSGGLDSAVVLAWAKHANYDIAAISVNYGQRHMRELDHAKQIAAHFNVSWTVANISPDVFKGSSQTDPNIPVPHGHYAAENMKITVVPNRNMVILSLAVAHAVSVGAQNVYFGAHYGDHAIYPDCREGFVQALSHASHLACGVHISAPFVYLEKRHIVSIGKSMDTPFSLTYSCYEGREKHCGKCGTCVERKEAFQLAGVEDPTEYE